MLLNVMVTREHGPGLTCGVFCASPRPAPPESHFASTSRCRRFHRTLVAIPLCYRPPPSVTSFPSVDPFRSLPFLFSKKLCYDTLSCSLLLQRLFLIPNLSGALAYRSDPSPLADDTQVSVFVHCWHRPSPSINMASKAAHKRVRIL
jgi:hypothetical protein